MTSVVGATPGMLSSAMPTAETPSHRLRSPTSVASMVTRRVVKVRFGNVISCPDPDRDPSPRSTVVWSLPSKVSVTLVIHRLARRWDWRSVRRSVVTGSW